MGEDELVAEAQAGVQGAMVELYHRHRGRIIGYVLRMTGDPDLADEVFAATFVAFFDHLERYQSRGHLDAYLLRIARSRLADEVKQRGRLGGRDRACPATESDPVDPTPGPVESMAASELAGRVDEALRRLPEPLREVVALRLFEGLDYATIAQIVGAGEATVRSRMRYALAALRKFANALPEP